MSQPLCGSPVGGGLYTRRARAISQQATSWLLSRDRSFITRRESERSSGRHAHQGDVVEVVEVNGTDSLWEFRNIWLGYGEKSYGEGMSVVDVEGIFILFYVLEVIMRSCGITRIINYFSGKI